MVKSKRLAGYAWFLLVFNMLVIVWGALVRATGSGAGCGNHWPLCNGVVVPQSPGVATLIEFVHRLTSGLDLPLVILLVVWVWRSYPKGMPVRKAAGFSLLFVLVEALVGAGLVKFEWVAQDASVGRTVTIVVHLVSTFLLLASLALTAWWASGGAPVQLRGRGASIWLFGIGLLAVLLIGATGAITALGDTLFPSASLAEGLAQDLDANAHFLIRLRAWHPAIAIATGFYILFLAGLFGMLSTRPPVKRLAVILGVLFVFQLAAGLVNILLLVPVAMQLIHLFLADSVWTALILFSAANMGVGIEETQAAKKPVTAAHKVAQ